MHARTRQSATAPFGAPTLLQSGVTLIYRFCARLALVGSIVLCAPAAWALPTFAQARDGFLPSDTLILSREGEVLQRLRTDATVRRGQWVALSDISPALRTALPTSMRPIAQVPLLSVSF